MKYFDKMSTNLRKVKNMNIFRITKYQKIRLLLNSSLFLLIFFTVETARGWDGHFLFTYVVLKNMPEVRRAPAVPAETLVSFLASERLGLAKLLRENEVWSQKNIPFYPSLPYDLEFNEDSSKPLQLRFLEAIRVNPTLKFPLFVQYPPGVPHRIHERPLLRSNVMLSDMANSAWTYTPNTPLEGLLPGEKVSPLEVITSSVDEPDYGMDAFLWQDNLSWFGERYQWGPQPFGNKRVPFSSQAPFHMGFYYESPLLYKLNHLLKHVFPEYRIHLYLVLSRFAFQTGHPYWGYRFLGWALHYIQDLTQPYHVTLAPNTSILKLIGVGLLAKIGLHGGQHDLVQLVSNRHFSLENYAYHKLKYLLEKRDENNLVVKSLINQSNNSHYPDYSDTYPRRIIANEAHEKANEIDSAIEKFFPKKYVEDPNYIFYKTEPDIDLFSIMKNQNKDMQPFDKLLAELFRSFGAHTRKVLKYGTQ